MGLGRGGEWVMGRGGEGRGWIEIYKKPDTDNIFKIVSIGYKFNNLPAKI